MAIYVWELGFNWNTATKNDNGTYNMSAGYVQSGSSTSLSDTPAMAVTGDLLQFTLWDLADPGKSSSPYTLSSFTLSSSGLEGTPVASPFSGNPTTLTLPVASAVLQSGTSPVFGNNKTQYPFSGFYSGGNTDSPMSSGLANQGVFRFNFSAVIGSGGTNRTFVIDPEMIVSGTGGPYRRSDS